VPTWPGDFLSSLVDNDVISEEIMAFALADPDSNTNSYIQIGGYNDDYSNGDVHWYDLLWFTEQWEIPLITSKYGGNDLMSELSPKYLSSATFEPGNDYISIPPLDYTRMISNMTKDYPDLYCNYAYYNKEESENRGLCFFFGACSDHESSF